MPEARLVRILALLRAAQRDRPGTSPLCSVAAGAMEVTGAGVMLMSGDVPRGSLCSSDRVSGLIEDLQYTLGEGPCIDAYEQDRPVMEPDLAATGPARWPGFSPPVLEAGVGAVFGFPLQVGGVRLGALNLYRAGTGALSDGAHADALVMAGVIARSVLSTQAGAPVGGLGPDLEAGADLRFVVHQAAGMVSAQLEVSVAEALIRLRARSFADGRPLVEVAGDVVARRLRFSEKP